MKKTIVAILTALLCLLAVNCPLQAAVPVTLTLNLNQTEDTVITSLIKSLSLKQGSSGWDLYINNTFMATAAAQGHAVSYQVNVQDVDFDITADVSTDALTISYSYNQVSSIASLISLSTKAGIHTLAIYPTLTGGNPVILQGTNQADGRTLFDELTYRYEYRQNNINHYLSVRFQCWLDTVNDILHVAANDETYEISCQTGQAVQSVFLEFHVDAHLLDINYLAKLPAYKTFADAKEVPYSRSEIAAIVRNEKITLTNSKTGLTAIESLQEFIDHWKRLDKEDYLVKTDEQLQVVCQWSEDVCQSVRQLYGQSGRTYAVFGASYTYQIPHFYTSSAIKLVPVYTDWSGWLERNDYNDQTAYLTGLETETAAFYDYDQYSEWSDYQYSDQQISSDDTHQVSVQYSYRLAEWSAYSAYVYDAAAKTDCQDSSECQWQSRLRYRQSLASWQSWSDYSASDKRTDCSDDENCEYRTNTFYARNTGKWGSFSAYKYEGSSDTVTDCQDSFDCQSASAVYYARIAGQTTGTYSSWQSACTAGAGYRCQAYYKYTCKYLLASSTAYSTLNYAVGDSGPCSGNYKVSAKTAGYRQVNVSYTAPAASAYTLTSCADSAGYYKCYRKTLYAVKYRSWSGLSSYQYDSCTDTSAQTSGTTYKCASKKLYSYRYKIWSAFSDWSDEECTEDDQRKCLSQVFYAFSYRSWADWSDWQADNPLMTGTDQQQKVRYRYTSRQWLNSAFGTVVPDNAVSRGQKTYYRYRQKGEQLQQVEVARMNLQTATLNTKEMMTESQIMTLADQIESYALQAAVLETLGNDATAEEFEQASSQKSQSLVDRAAKVRQEFLDSPLFVPYVYVTSHWRASLEKFNVRTYTADFQYLKQFSNSRSDTVNLTLSRQAASPNVRIIYFDQSNPLVNYDQLPANWQGRQQLLEAIEKADCSQAELVVTLSQADIQAIKKWLNENPDYEEYAFLRHFSYIFTAAPAGFWQKIAESEG